MEECVPWERGHDRRILVSQTSIQSAGWFYPLQSCPRYNGIEPPCPESSRVEADSSTGCLGVLSARRELSATQYDRVRFDSFPTADRYHLKSILPAEWGWVLRQSGQRRKVKYKARCVICTKNACAIWQQRQTPIFNTKYTLLIHNQSTVQVLEYGSCIRYKCLASLHIKL